MTISGSIEGKNVGSFSSHRISRQWLWLCQGALIAVVACLAYAPALHGKFLWDDNGHVTRPELQSPAGLVRIWFDVGATQQYYPLLHTAFWIEHKLWGDDPFGYHLANLVQHLVAACLVFLILRKFAFLEHAWRRRFLRLHPVMVESVAWITEQKNTLSAVFYFRQCLFICDLMNAASRRLISLPRCCLLWDFSPRPSLLLCQPHCS